MATNYNPRIVTDGLVLALDAGNNKSYSRNRFLCPGVVGEGASADNNVSFTLNGTGTFVRMGYGQTIGGYTIKPTDVVYRYSMGGTGCFFHGNKITVLQGSYVNFSFDYLVTGATTYPITNYLANIEDYSGGGLGRNSTAANNTQGIWQRRVLQSGPALTTVTDCNVFLYPGACNNPSGGLADSGTIYYKNPRVEFINYDPDPNSLGSKSGFSYSTNINVAYDISGSGNNGTFSGTGNAPFYSSENGGSLSFDGVDDNITIPYNSNLKPTSAITIEVFCYIQSNGGSWTSLIQYPQNSSSHISPFFDWALYLNMSGRYLHTRIDGEAVSSPNNVWNYNEWTHLAITFENQSVKYYVNGNNVGNSAVTKTSIIYDADNPVYIGKNASGTEQLNGRIGSIKVYNRALTPQEIQQNFNATRGRFGI